MDGLRNWKTTAMLLGGFVALIWFIEVVDVLPIPLDALGIRPRTTGGLLGILFAPFLHGSFAHLSANTGSFLLFGAALALTQGNVRLVVVSVFTAIVAGLAVWTVGASASVHIGASAMIFGYFGYLLVYGLVRRNIIGILTSLGLGIAYGGLVFGVLPGQAGISWEGHLFGFLSGGVLAVWLGRRERARDLAASDA